ncbi:hypothetical protein Tco_0507766 [Tanacetum coccineum]
MSSPGAPSTPSYSAGHSTHPSNTSGPSTPPTYSSGPSTPTNYSLGSSRNRECSNCKHLRGKISVLKATMEMHMHPEQHTVNSAALFHEAKVNESQLCAEERQATTPDKPRNLIAKGYRTLFDLMPHMETSPGQNLTRHLPATCKNLQYNKASLSQAFEGVESGGASGSGRCGDDEESGDDEDG